MGLVDGADFEDTRNPELVVVYVGDIDAVGYVVMIYKDVFLQREILGSNCKSKPSVPKKESLPRPV